MRDEPGGGEQEEPPAEPRPARRRLDPDRAARQRIRRHPPPQVIDTRPYQRLIGLFGLLLVIVISVAFLTSRGVGTAGIPAGRQLPLFAAPLATSNLNGAANLHPPCTEARHDPRALNVCLLVKRAPLVLAFFVTSLTGCEQAVSALAAVSAQVPAGQIQLAAVAVNSSHSAARRAVRQHHWTIPVAYDVDGRVGATYGVEVCPIVELVRRGGIVARRLIGKRWASPAALAPPVRALLASGG